MSRGGPVVELETIKEGVDRAGKEKFRHDDVVGREIGNNAGAGRRQSHQQQQQKKIGTGGLTGIPTPNGNKHTNRQRKEKGINQDQKRAPKLALRDTAQEYGQGEDWKDGEQTKKGADGSGC